jgi:hypothetical protein
MDSLVGKLRTADVRKALNRLPNKVDESYDDAMERIEQQDEERRTLAKQALMWITHAFRPLDVEELQHALAVESDVTVLDPEAIVPEAILISVCVGLVFVEEYSRNVRLVRTWLSDAETFPLLISSRLYHTGLL